MIIYNKKHKENINCNKKFKYYSEKIIHLNLNYLKTNYLVTKSHKNPFIIYKNQKASNNIHSNHK